MQLSQVADLGGRVKQMACGRDYCMCLMEDGGVVAFGENDHAQHGRCEHLRRSREPLAIHTQCIFVHVCICVYVILVGCMCMTYVIHACMCVYICMYACMYVCAIYTCI
jgi:hypothetical protein